MSTAAQSKSFVQPYDHCVITIGYQRYLMPRKAAMQFFEMLGTKEMYKLDNWYHDGTSEDIVELMESTSMPTISSYSVTQFHLARVAAERKAEKETQSKLA